MSQSPNPNHVPPSNPPAPGVSTNAPPAIIVTQPDSSISKSIAIALLSGLFAAALGLWGTYEITLKQIENPKLDFERRKVLLEAHRQILALSPKVYSKCQAFRWSNFEWRIECASENKGVYPAVVKIDDVFLTLDSDPTRAAYKKGVDYDIYHPKEKKSFLSPPESSPGVLEAFVMFRKSRYPKGVIFDGMEVNVRFIYQPVESAQKILKQTFPEQAGLVQDVSNRPPSVVQASLSGTAQPEQ